MREIILDTETTGLDPAAGHRVIEIGCLEVKNLTPTGAYRHYYLNPGREVPDDAVRIHGITTQFLQDKPLFAEIVEDFLDFLGEDRLVIHNAPFDIGFLNAELDLIDRPPLLLARSLDTVALARRLFPGAQASLDALCRRFGIDNSKRELHGALLDCQLLAEVYLELQGGRQPTLILAREEAQEEPLLENPPSAQARRPQAARARQPLFSKPSAEEEEAHQKLLEKIPEALWTKK